MTPDPIHRSARADLRLAERDWRDDALHAANASLMRDMALDPAGPACPWLGRIIEWGALSVLAGGSVAVVLIAAGVI